MKDDQTKQTGQAMSARHKRIAVILSAGVLVNAAYIFFCQVLLWSYPLKAAYRLVFFVGLPLLDWLVLRHWSWGDIWRRLRPENRQRRRVLQWVITCVALAAIACLLAKPMMGLPILAEGLAQIVARTGKSTGNLLFLLAYLPLVNALAEELFFRIYCCLEIGDLGMPRTGLIYSAALFTVYHLAIVTNWLSLPLILFMLGGLFLAGLLLGLVVRRERHVVSVWLIHGLVNVLMIGLCLLVAR